MEAFKKFSPSLCYSIFAIDVNKEMNCQKYYARLMQCQILKIRRFI